MTNMTGSKLSICSHSGKITGYWITTRSFPYQGLYWPGPKWASTSSQANMRSRDDSQANMEMPMYQSVYTNGVSSYQTCCPTKAFTKG